MLRTRVQEVIPMKRKAYRATAVNRVSEAEFIKFFELRIRVSCADLSWNLV